MHTPRPRILFLDAYDSFSNNIVSLLVDVTSAQVDILPIDAALLPPSPPSPDDDDDDDDDKDRHHRHGRHEQREREQLRRLVAHYDAVVCGPGPGSPACDRDVGLMRHVWALGGDDNGGDGDDVLLPALGICLGFQSLVAHCGGVVRRLSTGLHGMIREIDHVDNDLPLVSGNIFAGVPRFRATLYHSLFADISGGSGSSGRCWVLEDDDGGEKEEWLRSRWDSPAHLPDIVPLAWVTEHREGFDERILMGVKHKRKPFWGLQYHPESVCTENAGHQVIRNWFAEAVRWNKARGRTTTAELPLDLRGLTCSLPKKPETLSRQLFTPDATIVAAAAALRPPPPLLWDHGLGCEYHSRTLRLPNHVEVPDVVESLQAGRRDFVVLDSASAKTARTGLDVKGRYSIIALDVDEALRLEYRTGSRRLTLRRCFRGGDDSDVRGGSNTDNDTKVEEVDFGDEHTIWTVLAAFWSRRQLPAENKEDNGSTHPFYGGFMGFTTYELGLEGIDVQPLGRRDADGNVHDRPDLSFAWVTRSAVVDHMEGTIRLQTLSAPSLGGPLAASAWLDKTASSLVSSPVWADGLGADFSSASRGGSDGDQRMLYAVAAIEAMAQQPTPPLTPETRSSRTTTRIHIPDAGEYEDKVRECQGHIAAGDSYELCLTDQTLITRPRSPGAGLVPVGRHHHNNNGSSISSQTSAQAQSKLVQQHQQNQQQHSATETSWSLYRALRARNPAPFGSYVRLGGATLVSSSPERFLEFRGATGLCSMRPMKGTVKKSAAVSTMAQAERILHVPKEEAENLMIVDLVRHDLHSVCGTEPGAVRVPQLLKVEEYASVFQMISVVEGQLPLLPPSSPPPQHQQQQQQLESGNDGDSRLRVATTGLDVLAATLPPGSMTGAPKKRSCELLQHIEGGTAAAARAERSLYSGVVGYMDVRGNGDWSVTIRSLFRWDDEAAAAPVPTSAARTGEDGAQPHEVWHIGAGGAVTALSTPLGEREEMFTKLKGPLGVFDDQE
ncbi:para-aminobenzoate synthetase [Microdochium nivale]|nr:para-aminobenzoate synthetase [Microdochium nivale]